MSKISTYPLDTTITLDDKVIGSDSENSNATKNYLLSDIVSLFSSESLVPYTGATGDVDLGSNSLSLNDITLSGRISADGGFGTSGYVLTSQGSGSPAKWQSSASIFSTYLGSFYDTTDQIVASGGIAAFKYNTTDISNGVSITNDLSSQPTRITVANPGVYNIQFSAQLQRLSGGASKKVTIWLRVNGTDVPNTATNLTVQANATYLLAAWNFYQVLTANQYAEIMWTQDDAIDIVAEPADLILPHPAIPSIILTVNKVG
jgi:hypothetical protein